MIALDDVGAVLGDRRVLDGVRLEVEAGCWTTLIGPNGAGKSTLMRGVAGLIACSGAVAVAGEDPRALSPRRRARRLALVPQNPLLPLDMPVYEYVLLGRTPFLGLIRHPGRDDRGAVASAIERLDLEPLAERRLGALSGGERQRAVLARALAQEAPILLLDEPTAALDVGRQQEVLDLVAELRDERELTVLAAMHDLTLAAQYADRLALLDAGRLVESGEPGRVLSAELISRHYQARVRIADLGGETVVAPSRRQLTEAAG